MSPSIPLGCTSMDVAMQARELSKDKFESLFGSLPPLPLPNKESQL